MKPVEVYSHQNGQEHILVHKPQLWAEILQVIESVDATTCRTKEVTAARMKGAMRYNAVVLNRAFRLGFRQRGWQQPRTVHQVTSDQQLIRRTMQLPPALQKEEIAAVGKAPIYSYNQTDFVKERLAVEVQFGKYAFVAYDLFVKHMAFYVGDVIDVGIEILPMKELSAEMSSGVCYYEGGLYNVLRHGRGSPAVPLVLIGVTA